MYIVSNLTGVYRILTLSRLIAVILFTGIFKERIASAAEWDNELPAMQLHNVRIDSPSLIESWQQLGQRLQLRTVLVSIGTPSPSQDSFTFDSDSCYASELLDAFVAHYSKMAWTQDPNYGVIWIHPKTIEYTSILQKRYRVATDQLGVPMLDGIVYSLVKASQGSLTAEYVSPGLRNTYNYAVDLPAGNYTVRDVLNQCCSCAPLKTLFVKVDVNNPGVAHLYNVNNSAIETSGAPTPAPGSLLHWQLGIGPVNSTGPDPDTLLMKLGDNDARVREAAHNYYRAERFRYKLERKLHTPTDPIIEAWFWVAHLEDLVRLQGFTDTAARKRLHVLATDEAILTWPIELSVLVAMDLGRDGYDMHPLDMIAQRNYKTVKLNGVRSKMFAIARMSSEVQNKTAGLAQKLAFDDASFAALISVPSNPRRSESPTDRPPMVEFKLQTDQN